MAEITDQWKARTRHFQFVIVSPDDLPADEAAALAEGVTDAFYSHGGMVFSISSFLIVGGFGMLHTADSSQQRKALVADLLANFGNRIRIAHGQCNGIVGNLGSKYRSSYGAMIPGFQEIREKLERSDLNTCFEALNEE